MSLPPPRRSGLFFFLVPCSLKEPSSLFIKWKLNLKQVHVDPIGTTERYLLYFNILFFLERATV